MDVLAEHLQYALASDNSHMSRSVNRTGRRGVEYGRRAAIRLQQGGESVLGRAPANIAIRVGPLLDGGSHHGRSGHDLAEGPADVVDVVRAVNAHPPTPEGGVERPAKCTP